MASAPNTRRTRHERIDLFLAHLVEKCLGRLTIVAADSRSIDCSLRSLYLTRLQLNLGVGRTMKNLLRSWVALTCFLVVREAIGVIRALSGDRG